MSNQYLLEGMAICFGLGALAEYVRGKAADFFDDRRVILQVRKELAKGRVSSSSMWDVERRVFSYGREESIPRGLRAIVFQIRESVRLSESDLI